MASITHLESRPAFSISVHDGDLQRQPLQLSPQPQQPLRSSPYLDTFEGNARTANEAFARARRRQDPTFRSVQRLTGGQQFRVGNIGQNGALYLRPVSRPPQPFATLPKDPPSSNGPVLSDDYGPSDFNWRGSLTSGTEALWSPQRPPVSLTLDEDSHLPIQETSPESEAARPRSLSISSQRVRNERHLRSHSNPKLLAERPRKRSRTGSLHLLEVPIPHYRLGTPHFSGKGSAILHSSLHTDSSFSEGQRSSTTTGPGHDPLTDQLAPRQSFSSELLLPESRTRLSSSAQSDDTIMPGIVRLSSTNGQIMSATPSGLIAQITSPNILDYQLLSDFFLTFRSYLTTRDLVGFLVTRLRWAVERDDDFGRVVRVRTFVALRHWILNYFVDDFACDYAVRVQFCNLVNQLCDDLQARSDGGFGDLKVLGELKKCWRRTCALYWDIAEHQTDSELQDVLPGGLLGSRDANAHGSVRQPHARPTPSKRRLDAGSFGRAKGFQQNHEHSTSSRLPDEVQSSTLDQGTSRPPVRRYSDESVDVSWCSVPRLALHKHRAKPGRSLTSRPIASTQHPVTAEQSPPGGRTTKRLDLPGDGSSDYRTTDILPEPVPTALPHEAMIIPFPGSLIRGVVIQPTSPYIEGALTNNLTDESSFFEPVTAEDMELFTQDGQHFSESNPGVRRMLGPVRRALSARKPSASSYPGDGSQRSARLSSESHGPRRSIVRLSKGKSAIGRSQVRIDLLAANISQSFKAAVKEDAEEEKVGGDAQKVPVERESHGTRQSGSVGVVTPNLDPLKSNPVTEDDEILRLSGHHASLRALEHQTLISPEQGQRQVHEPGKVGDHGKIRDDPLYSDPQMASAPRGASCLFEAPPQSESGRGSYGIHGRQHDGGNDDRQDFQSAGSEAPEPNSDDTPAASLAQFGRSGESQDLANVLTSPRSLEATGVVSDDSQTLTNDPFYLDRLPARQLRRQPGGDLRAVDHVHSLIGLPQTRSLGSASDVSHHLSEFPPLDLDAESQDGAKQVSANELRKSIQILPTPPTQTLQRTSFDLEVAKLAQLPDNEEDDGGIESALRKLEGRSEERPTEQPGQVNATGPHQVQDRAISELRSQPLESHEHPYREEEIFGVVHTEPQWPETLAESYRLPPPSRNHMPSKLNYNPGETTLRPDSVAASDDSYSSTPLLERGASHSPLRRKRSSSDWLAVSLPHAASEMPAQPEYAETEFLFNTKSGPSPISSSGLDEVGAVSHDETDPISSEPHQSFLLDDNQSLRSIHKVDEDIQTVGGAQSTSGMRSFYDDDVGDAFRVSDILPHPLRHPRTPPKTQDLSTGGRRDSSLSAEAGRTQSPMRHVPLQDRVDFHAQASSNVASAKPIGMVGIDEKSQQPPPSTGLSTAHLPFILSYEALQLAQQLTLIERDALSEIDWRELVDIRWKQAPNDNRNWVEYLRETSKSMTDQGMRGGVDVCISRFNIVVKWAVSEIVLTQDSAERVACIIKYIHIAHYCKRLQNWATMFQVTMALISADVARLTQTWTEVPEREREILKALEALIMPMRNFHNLRVQMEMVGESLAEDEVPGANGGCIPFIGIYTHDLIYNAQKPAYIRRAEDVAKEGNEEPLVNFDRHRTAAAIVKSLLGMIEASGRYAFRAEPEVLSRCLWIAALGDAEIERRSRLLEP